MAANIFAGISALAAIAALFATVMVAHMSLRQQLRLAREERTWATRSALYVDLLVWLDEQSKSAEALRNQVAFRRSAAEAAGSEQERNRLMATIEASIEGNRPQSVPVQVHGIEPAVDDEEGQSSSGESASRPDDIMAVWDHFDPPVELRERLNLYASDDVREGFEDYRATRAFPILVQDEVEAWIATFDLVHEADDKFRHVIVNEVATFTGNRPRKSHVESVDT